MPYHSCAHKIPSQVYHSRVYHSHGQVGYLFLKFNDVFPSSVHVSRSPLLTQAAYDGLPCSNVAPAAVAGRGGGGGAAAAAVIGRHAEGLVQTFTTLVGGDQVRSGVRCSFVFPFVLTVFLGLSGVEVVVRARVDFSFVLVQAFLLAPLLFFRCCAFVAIKVVHLVLSVLKRLSQSAFPGSDVFFAADR